MESAYLLRLRPHRLRVLVDALRRPRKTVRDSLAPAGCPREDHKIVRLSEKIATAISEFDVLSEKEALVGIAEQGR